MKCLIFLALVALSSASVFSVGGYGVQREIRVDGDRRIFVRSSTKIIVFNVPRDDRTSIEIVVKDQDKMMKLIKIDNDKRIIKRISLTPGGDMDRMLFEEHGTNDDRRSKERKPDLDNPQMRLLVSIFRKYEGIAGEATFYQLLREVKQSVERQELHPIIYDVLSDLEIQPRHVINLSQRDQKLETPEEESDTTTVFLNAETARPRELRDRSRSMESPTYDEADQRAKLAQAMQAALQIQWIQSLLDNKRHQQLSDTPNYLSRHGDISRDTDSYLRSAMDHSNYKEGDLRNMVFQTDIQELQREIVQEQLRAQQLLIQQQLLSGQKQQLKLHQQMGHHQGLRAAQMQELRDTYDQVKTHEQKLIEEQLNIQKTIHRLQERLIRQQEQFREDLRKEDTREDRYL